MDGECTHMNVCGREYLNAFRPRTPCRYRCQVILNPILKMPDNSNDYSRIPDMFPVRTLLVRAWAHLHNFCPWNPHTAKRKGAKCPAENLTGSRYRENWLENFRVAGSMGGCRHAPKAFTRPRWLIITPLGRPVEPEV